MKKFIPIFAFTALISLMLNPVITDSDSKEKPLRDYSTKGEYMVLADIYSAKFGTPVRHTKATLKCESNFDNLAIGDHGKAHTVAQFHEPTFNRYSKQYFNETGVQLEYGNGNDAILLFNWAVSKGYQGAWSCWKKTK